MADKNALIDKTKRFIKTPIGLFAVVGVGALILFTLIIKILTGGSNTDIVAQKMQTQQSQQVAGNVHYTTQETLSTLTGETANIQQGLENVQNQVSDFTKDQSQKTQAAITQLETELQSIKQQNTDMRKQMQDALQKEQQKLASFQNGTSEPTSSDDSTYQVGGATTAAHNGLGLVWLNDQSTQPGDSYTGKKAMSPSSGSSDASLLHPGSLQSPFDDKQAKEIPAYTIPANTLMTGVTPEQPLVGMIPTDGTVVNPQSVMFMIGANNLAANNWHLPPTLKGIQGNAVCQGVFVWFNDAYANCQITSLTFIFNDGRIATANVKDGESFGHLTTLYGSPNIPGTYHGNALYAGMGTGAFAGLQGLGNAYAAQQQQVSSVGSQTVVSYNNALASGLGTSVGTAGQYMNQWWQQLLKSTTDFVFVPNWDQDTHQILQLNAVISREVEINYNPNGRKVNYDNFNQTSYNNSLN